MRHFRDRRAIADAIAEMFRAEGARIVDRDGVTFAMFFDDDLTAPMPVANINIDRLAAEIEGALS